MAAPYNPPAKGEDFIIGVSLQSMTESGSAQVDPTLATGDVKVSKDFGSFANLNTLPVVTPASGKVVKLTLSATEMDADVVTVQFVDQTDPKEWADLVVSIPTTS